MLGRTAVANTELVAAYMAIDPRVRELCLLTDRTLRSQTVGSIGGRSESGESDL